MPLSEWIAATPQHFAAVVLVGLFAVIGFGFCAARLTAAVVFRVWSLRRRRRARSVRFCYNPGAHTDCGLPPAPQWVVEALAAPPLPKRPVRPAVPESPSWGLDPLGHALDADGPSARAVSDAVEDLIVPAWREADQASEGRLP